MQAFFWFMFIVACIGKLLGMDTLQRLFYNQDKHQLYWSQNPAQRIWVGVTDKSTKSVKVNVKFLGNPARELAKDIEIVTGGRILAETLEGYSYSEILADLTPDQVRDIEEVRSFLK